MINGTECEYGKVIRVVEGKWLDHREEEKSRIR